MRKTLKALCGKIAARGIALVAVGMLLPSTVVSAYDQTMVDEMLEPGSIFYYEPESESTLKSSVFFTKVGDNGVDSDEIIKNNLEANTTYTLHLVIQNRSHNDIRDATLYVPLVAEPVKVSRDPADEPSSLTFTLKGRMLGDDENPERGVEYLHLLDLMSDDNTPMSLRYIPNTARCYSVTWQGEEREAALLDVELCSEGIGALISTDIERYGTDEDPKFRVDDRYGIDSSSQLCEVRLTVQTSEGEGVKNKSDFLVSAGWVVIVIIVLALVASLIMDVKRNK